MSRNPDDDWCLEHNTYEDRCQWRHDLPNVDDLPDPRPEARP